jgi:hypothetical protein
LTGRILFGDFPLDCLSFGASYNVSDHSPADEILKGKRVAVAAAG